MQYKSDLKSHQRHIRSIYYELGSDKIDSFIWWHLLMAFLQNKYTILMPLLAIGPGLLIHKMNYTKYVKTKSRFEKKM